MHATDFTILIQGPLHSSAVSCLEQYRRAGAQVLVSFWDSDLERAAGHPLLVRDAARANPVIVHQLGEEAEPQPRMFVRSSSPHPEWRCREPDVRMMVTAVERDVEAFVDRHGFGKHSNLYKQVLTTLDGLDEVRTEFVIKLRSDENYNLDPIFERVRASPGKIVTNNVFFFPDRYRRFKISDHLMAGTLADMRAMWLRTKHQIEIDDTVLRGISTPAVEAAARVVANERASYLRDDGLVAGQLLCVSFIREREGAISVERSRELTSKYFDVVPLAALRPYEWSVSTRFISTSFVDRLRADPAFAQRMGIRLIGDHVCVTSDAEDEGGIETPAVRHGLCGNTLAMMELESSVGIQSIDEL